MTDFRLDDNGSLDEMVGDGVYHLEQMTSKHWYLSLGGCRIQILCKGKKIVMRPLEHDTWSEAKKAHGGGDVDA